MSAVDSYMPSLIEREFEKIVAPDRWRTSRRFRGLLAARHGLGAASGIVCEIALWRRAPWGWVVGLTWRDGADADARSEQVDTLDAAMTFIETEGRDAIDAAADRPAPKARGTDAAKALIRPFLRRQAAAELRRAFDELAGRALLDWQTVFGATDARAAR